MGRLRLIVAEVKVTHVKLVPGINELLFQKTQINCMLSGVVEHAFYLSICKVTCEDANFVLAWAT